MATCNYTGACRNGNGCGGFLYIKHDTQRALLSELHLMMQYLQNFKIPTDYKVTKIVSGDKNG